MAARELRYHWFEQIKQEFDYQYIVTAHHASDNIETVLYNLAKGSGLLGLTGMKPKRDAIIRPLLWAKKEEILSYAQNNGLTFREDASNNSDKYARNYIRHHIIPAFQHLNQSSSKFQKARFLLRGMFAVLYNLSLHLFRSIFWGFAFHLVPF